MVRELRGGRNHSRRARRRGSRARAEPISQRHCIRSVEEKNVLVFGAGEGGGENSICFLEECFSLFQERSLETAGTDALGPGMTTEQRQCGPSCGIPQRNQPALYSWLSPPGPQSSVWAGRYTDPLSPLLFEGEM